jgi:putative flippase GtrA
VMIKKQFFVFLIYGAFAAFVNIFVRWLVNFYFNFHVSIILGHIAGMVFAFISFRKIVFVSKNNKSHEISKFIVSNIISFSYIFITSNTLLIIFSKFLVPSSAANVSHIFAVGSSAIISFLLHKFFTFRKK